MTTTIIQSEPEPEPKQETEQDSLLIQFGQLTETNRQAMQKMDETLLKQERLSSDLSTMQNDLQELKAKMEALIIEEYEDESEPEINETEIIVIPPEPEPEPEPESEPEPEPKKNPNKLAKFLFS